MSDILWNVLPWAWFLFWVFGRNIYAPLLQEYRFGKEGIDVILLGCIRILRIRREDISEATIMPALQVRLRYPFAWNVGNRYARKVLVVRTARGRAYMLTPRHLQDAQRTVQAMIGT